MNYTNTLLIVLGLLGMVLHNLVAMNKLNKASDGNLNYKKYFKLEWISMLINVIVLIVAVIVKSEITQLELAGKWLGVAFMCIGYMGQSLLTFAIGKANKVIEDKPNDNGNPA